MTRRSPEYTIEHDTERKLIKDMTPQERDLAVKTALKKFQAELDSTAHLISEVLTSFDVQEENARAEERKALIAEFQEELNRRHGQKECHVCGAGTYDAGHTLVVRICQDNPTHFRRVSPPEEVPQT